MVCLCACVCLRIYIYVCMNVDMHVCAQNVHVRVCLDLCVCDVYLSTPKILNVQAAHSAARHAVHIKICSLAVIGGGLMGAGIACAALMKGIPVRIKEIDERQTAAAASRVKGTFGLPPLFFGGWLSERC